jgi:hypothetical protein
VNIVDTKFGDLLNPQLLWVYMEQVPLWIGMSASETAYALMFVPYRFMIWLIHPGIRFLTAKLTQQEKKTAYNA